MTANALPKDLSLEREVEQSAAWQFLQHHRTWRRWVIAAAFAAAIAAAVAVIELATLATWAAGVGRVDHNPAMHRIGVTAAVVMNLVVLRADLSRAFAFLPNAHMGLVVSTVLVLIGAGAATLEVIPAPLLLIGMLLAAQIRPDWVLVTAFTVGPQAPALRRHLHAALDSRNFEASTGRGGLSFTAAA